MHKHFKDRQEAGQELAIPLVEEFVEKKDTIVLALPRGGVPVAHEVAEALGLPMDIWVVRKLGVPDHEELAMGAVALNGSWHINEDITSGMRILPRLFNEAVEKAKDEILRRNALYRQGRPMPEIKGRTVILVDDGLATGATMHAAIVSLRHAEAGRIVVAVPVGAKEACRNLKEIADDIICLATPEPFESVGQWYQDFSQISDAEVLEIMALQSEAEIWDEMVNRDW